MLKTQQSHQILNPRDYSHIDYGTIERHNSLIRDYEILTSQKEPLVNAVASRRRAKDSRETRIMFTLIVLAYLGITIATNDFTYGLWSIPIVPVLFGLFSKESKIEDEDRLSTINTEITAIDNRIAASKLNIDRSEALAKETLFKRDAQYWLDMSGWEFEKQVARLYEADGFSVVVTKGSSDGGVDLFLKKEGHRYAVQCKNHKKPIGPASIRDLYGAMRHERVRYGIFISSGGYTSGAKDFARDKAIELLDISDVIALHKNLSTF